MRTPGKSAVRWGLVGGLSFLVLHQGYVLAGYTGIGLPAAIAVAVVVGVLTTVLAEFLESKLVDVES